jgi:hypothetical protein
MAVMAGLNDYRVFRLKGCMEEAMEKTSQGKYQ